MNIRNELLGTGRKTPSAYWTKRMLRKASFKIAPRKRGGCLPEGEDRGGGFALGELPHPYPRLISYRKDILNNSICKHKQKKAARQRLLNGAHNPAILDYLCTRWASSKAAPPTSTSTGPRAGSSASAIPCSLRWSGRSSNSGQPSQHAFIPLKNSA